MSHVKRAIHSDVASAECDELIAAGYGDVERHLIPADWRTRQHIPMCAACHKRPATEGHSSCGYCQHKLKEGIERRKKRRVGPRLPPLHLRGRKLFKVT